MAPLLVLLALSVADMIFPVGLFFWGIPLLVAVVSYFEAGSLELHQAILVCLVGNFSASQINHRLAHWLLLRMPKYQAKLEHPLFTKLSSFTGATVLFSVLYCASRFVSLTRPTGPVFVGATLINYRHFMLLDFVASLIWVTVWCVVAWYSPELLRGFLE